MDDANINRIQKESEVINYWPNKNKQTRLITFESGWWLAHASHQHQSRSIDTFTHTNTATMSSNYAFPCPPPRLSIYMKLKLGQVQKRHHQHQHQHKAKQQPQHTLCPSAGCRPKGSLCRFQKGNDLAKSQVINVNRCQIKSYTKLQNNHPENQI